MANAPPRDVQSPTERIDPRFAELDSWSTPEIIAAAYEGQLAAAATVQPILPAIAGAVDDAIPALVRGGRLVYVGAGTSGRIAVQDGAELVPTFNWPPERLVFLMAGGIEALTQSVEGAEDDEADGTRAVIDAKISADDVVLATAASGTTRYTLGALRAARKAGALTIAIASNPHAPLLQSARHPLLVETGSELIAGSTRLKAGTAQKIVLNLFSTTLMVRLGRVYRGLMVDLRATNAKLKRRAVAIVCEITGCVPADAARHLEEASGDVKSAVLIAFGLDLREAARLLERHHGSLRAAIRDSGHGPHDG